MTGSTDRPDFAGPPETANEVSGPSGPVTVVEQGAGPSVLIVHGGSGDVTAWAQVAGRLAGGFRVLRYTRPLYRVDPPPTGARAVAAEVGDLLAVARAAAAPVLLVGHSSGAVVALEAALAEPPTFRGLILYEPPLDVTHSPAGSDALRRARAALDAGSPAEAMRIHLIDLVGMPADLIDQMLAHPQAQSFVTGVAAGQIADNEMLDALPVGLDRFAAVDVPTLLLCGENSPTHLIDRSGALAEVLPHPPRRVVLAGQTHGAEREDPDAVAAAIWAFAATAV
ncbi:alpha/beta fold hydrolase [Nakamurella sp.]|uniref:alpha/beta fold hydrolase n=1 Tax=Nakamurella sp. TaxID=1869182 RepID=UPI003784DCEA